MKADGLEGMWNKHIEELKNGDRVAHYLDDWYNYEPNISWKIWDWNWKDIAASLGSRALMFKQDEKNIAVHSQVKTWQSVGGYNDIYDDVFHLGTFGNMKKINSNLIATGRIYIYIIIIVLRMLTIFFAGNQMNLNGGLQVLIWISIIQM